MSKRRGNFLLLGALIGFIAGLFFAPKKGSELRRDAKNKIDEIKDATKIAMTMPIVSNQSKSWNKKIVFMAKAISKILIIGSARVSMNSLKKLFFFLLEIAFVPYFFLLAATSSLFSPVYIFSSSEKIYD